MKDFLITCLGCPWPEISEFTSESVIKHAEFLFSQILSYQQAGDAEEMKYMDSPLIKRIYELAGVQKASLNKSSKLVVDWKAPLAWSLIKSWKLKGIREGWRKKQDWKWKKT